MTNNTESLGKKDGQLFRLAAISLIFFAIFAVYNRTLDNPMIWDDTYLLRDNAFIHDLSNIKHLVDSKYFTQPIEISYRPLVTLTYMLEFSAWDTHVGGYHFTNLAIHFLNALMVMWLLGAITGKQWLAAAGALLFALHPVQTEAVNLITFREDMMCLFFLLAALSAHVKFKDTGGGIYAICSSILFLAALLSKETAAVFPFALYAYDIFIRKDRIDGKAVARSLLYIAPLAAYLVVRFGVLRGPEEALIYHNNSAYSTMILMLQAFAKYLNLIVWPAKQCVDYLFPNTPSITDNSTVSGIFLILALSFLSWLLYLKNRKFAFGIIWMILFMLPVSNIIPIGVVMAERYLYIPIAGFIAALVVALDSFFSNKDEKKSPAAATALLLAAALCCGLLAANRNKVWDSELGFWTSACDCAPQSGKASVNLGLAYINLNMDKKGAEALLRAVRISEDRNFSDMRYGTLLRALTNLGVIAARQGRMDEAISMFKQAIMIKSNAPLPMINLGIVYLKLGMFEESERYFKMGLINDHTNATARLYFALALKQNGKIDEAVEQCDTILKISPGNIKATKLRERLLLEKSHSE